MSRRRLVITEEAASDIANARRWYQEQAELGAAFVEQVEEQLRFIESHPEARPDIVHGIRRSVVKRFPYNVYYSINGAFIDILAVWHGKRDQHPIARRMGS